MSKELLLVAEALSNEKGVEKTVVLECQNKIFDATNPPTQCLAYRCIVGTLCEIQQVLPLPSP